MSFDLVEPSSLGEAFKLLDPDDPAVRPLAGGTALMLLMKSGFFRPKRLVSLRAASDRLARVRVEPDGAVRIGAMVRLAALERAPELRRGCPVIGQTLRTLSNVRVRNVATLGGHLAHADPHSDLPPVLIALDARLVLAGPRGERTVPVDGFATGLYETQCKGDELIVETIIPPAGGKRAAYVKCTTRSADDWPALGVAAAWDDSGGTIKSPRIVLGAATEKPTRLAMAESVIAGHGLDDALLARAGAAAAEEAEIVGDARGSVAYKKQLVKVFVGRALRAAQARGGAPA
ncbi:MAG TPA: xanthine dehydrogenase family protein subunit M [Stellaceae bacterium]|nr:xanthine dehydrogenase family protein subunit M [Stellaceae bacterium]